jgi:molybdate transport system substrate-binding protein
MKKIFLAVAAILVIVHLSACTQKEAKQQAKVEITISAAASLNDSLINIKEQFEKENNQITLLYNIGGSGGLKQQLLQGAPADIFISAAHDQFNELIEKGVIDKQQQVDLLSNQLVLIINKNHPTAIKQFSDLEKKSIKKLAIGTPETVPAGLYAKQTLQNLGLWDIVQPKLIQTKDVRQVLTYVETGNVDAGIVYMTDVKTSDKVKVVSIADQQEHEPIIYPAGIVKNSPHKKEAALFLDYLQSESARTIFKKYGFKVLD